MFKIYVIDVIILDEHNKEKNPIEKRIGVSLLMNHLMT